MQRSQEDIDRYFRDSLGDFQVRPDDAVWEKISGRLAKKRRSLVPFMIIRLAAGIALVSALGFILFYIVRDRDRNSTVYENISGTGQVASPGQSRPEAPPATLEAPPDRAGMQGSVNGQNQASGPEPAVTPIDESRPAAITESTGTGQIPAADPPLNRLDRKRAGILPLMGENMNLTESLAANPVSPVIQPAYETMPEMASFSPAPVRKSWILGGEIAPVYSYRHIASEDLDNRQLADLNDAENGILAYAGGIHVSYSPSGKFSIQSGLYYARYGQEKQAITHYRSANAGVDQATESLSGLDAVAITNSTGYITSSLVSKSNTDYFLVLASNSYSLDNLEDVSAVQFFDYLEFPLIFRYKLIDRKTDLKLVGGMLTSLLVGNQVYLKQDGDARYYGRTVSVRSVNIVGTVGLGFTYPFSEDFMFNIEPRFGYYLNSIDMDSEIRVHPYSFGIFTGVSYRF